MVFPTFVNLSLNLAIRSSWSEPQSAPSLVFADCIELLHLTIGLVNAQVLCSEWKRDAIKETGFLLNPEV